MGASCLFRHPGTTLGLVGSGMPGHAGQVTRLEPCGACRTPKPVGSLRPIPTIQGTPSGAMVCNQCYNEVQQVQHDCNMIPLLTDLNQYLVQRAGWGYRNAQIGHVMGVVLRELRWQLAPPERLSSVSGSGVRVPAGQVDYALHILHECRTLVDDGIQHLHQAYPWTRPAQEGERDDRDRSRSPLRLACEGSELIE